MGPSNAVPFDMAPDILPFDSEGGDFLYGSDQRLFVLTGTQTTLQVGTARPCGQIENAAISGVAVIYSEIVAAGYSGDGNADCPNFGDAVDWYVSITDFNGTVRQVARGTYAVPPGSDTASAAPDVAIAAGAYGFSRPDKGGKSAVVEVHLLDDDTQIFHSDPFHLPVQILRGAERLVIIGPGPVAVGDSNDTLSIWSATDWQPLEAIGLTSGAVALSPDGQTLAFAGCLSPTQCTFLNMLSTNGDSGISLPATATSVSTVWGPTPPSPRRSGSQPRPTEGPT
ncbi:MAG TPA: hypothetical protein VF337_03795 [Candidatus Limnocylindrales bacterium]